jgi:LysM repeat protein
LWIPLALLIAFAAYWGYERLPIERVLEEGAAVAQAQLSDMVPLPEIAAAMAAPTQAVATATPTRVAPTPAPTRTPTATPTRPPSATPAPTPTATATGGAREYVVQSGDSLALIGEKLDLSWQTIATLNGLTAYSMLQPGDKLRLPTLTPAPTRATATATPGTVRPTAAAATATATATETATPAVAAATAVASPTPVAATATPRPSPTLTPTPTKTPAPLLATLILINPGDGSSYEGQGAQIELQWQNKDYLPTGAIYRVTLQWLNKGTMMTDRQDTTATSIRAPLWLWGEADQPGRQYTWSVQMVQLATDGKGGERIIPLNPPSEKRTFYWK